MKETFFSFGFQRLQRPRDDELLTSTALPSPPSLGSPICFFMEGTHHHDAFLRSTRSPPFFILSLHLAAFFTLHSET